MAIREDSATVYTAIAIFRRELGREPDLPAEILRDMLTQTLTALELLLQAVDRNQDTLEQVQRNRERGD